MGMIQEVLNAPNPKEMTEKFDEEDISEDFFNLLNKLLTPASNASLNVVLVKFGMLMAVISKDRKETDFPDVAKGYLERTINAYRSESPTTSISVEPCVSLHTVN